MKLFKKLAAALVATMLVMAMVGTSAFAATVVNESGTIISKNKFKAYPIFTGKQASGSKVLTEIQWATGFNSNGFVNELKTVLGDNNYVTTKTAAEIAELIGKYKNDSEQAKKVARAAYKYIGGSGIELTVGKGNNVPAGYYLIVDDTPVEGVEGAVANAALLQVTDTITITVKTDKPDVEKKVIENEKYGTGKGKFDYQSGSYLVEHENDTADYNIGDTVPFKLHSVVPDMSYYVGDYWYIFHDTMAKSLDFVPGSVVVKVNGNVITSGYNAPEYDEAKHELTVAIPDLDAIADQGDLVTVEFEAKLNKDAYIGRAADGSGTGNVNKVYLEYSNQPNYEGSGTKTGKTPEDKVIVFTYQLDVNKIDPSGTALDGAKFKFYKESSGTKLYVTTKDNRVSGWTATEASGTEFVSASGTFSIIGLDAGTYKLVETEAPATYNKLKDDITVVIEADTTNGQNGDANVMKLASVFVKANNKSGTTSSGTNMALSFSVKNEKGTILPSTGGIGTTIFYVLGAILVLGGGVLLVTRRRMAA